MRHQGTDSKRATAFARARHAARNGVASDPPAGKPHPAVCMRCHATHRQGRWRWDPPPPALVPVLCPACRCIRDGLAAHVIELSGALPPSWNEVRGIVGNVARAETQQHPMERVMQIEVQGDKVLVPTTGTHMARRIVAALVRRWRHGVRLVFADAETRVEWLEPREVRR